MPGYPNPLGRMFFDDDGAPLAGGTIEGFAAGTTTPLAFYTTSALGVAHANPATLSAAGRLMTFVEDGVAYKFRIRDVDGVLIEEVDNVSVPEVEAAAVAAEVPTGALFGFGGTAAPTGYLLCDGTAYSRTTYSTLFAVLGTAYGVGNGSTTFNVPDYRGRFLLGVAASGTGSTRGGTGGTIDHVHTGPSHTHDAGTYAVPSGGAHTHTTGAPSATADLQLGAGEAAAGSTHTHDIASSGAHTHTITGVTGASGTGNTGTANPPFQASHVIIKI